MPSPTLFHANKYFYTCLNIVYPLVIFSGFDCVCIFYHQHFESHSIIHRQDEKEF